MVMNEICLIMYTLNRQMFQNKYLFNFDKFNNYNASKYLIIIR